MVSIVQHVVQEQQVRSRPPRKHPGRNGPGRKGRPGTGAGRTARARGSLLERILASDSKQAQTEVLGVRNYAPTTVREARPRPELQQQVRPRRRESRARTSESPRHDARHVVHARRISEAMDGGALARGIAGLQHGFGPLLDRIALRLSRPHALAMFLASLGFLVTVSAVVTPSSLVVDAVSETPEIRLQGDTTVEAAMSDHVSPKSGYAGVGGSASVAPQQFQSLQVREYTLKPGDTLSELAVKFDLNMGTLISFNRISDVRRMEAGDTYRIPNRDGILYTVRRGDSLSEIAARHDTTVNGILDANDLASSTIRVNQTLFVPGAEMDPVEVKLILGELFAYPAQGRYTSGFGMRDDPFTGVRRFHNGIDIANEVGTPVTAAMGGTVAHVGNQLGNYGKFLIMKHPKGYQTLYAHLHSVEVSKGTYLSQGERLGTLGNTGRSTGPHVHFSIIENGSFVDPLDYLR